MFDFSKVEILHLETSSICNAACPMCPRENDKFFNKESDDKNLSLEKIKELFDVNFIKQLKFMFMCGGYGDPAVNPECIGIFEYFRELNSNIMLGMHTNGSLRNIEFWSKLGTILNKPGDYCEFGIDGLHDTNHIYRVNTDFDKIIENATTFINAGGNANWTYLVFKHNEHQVEHAKELSKKLRFKKFNEKITRRFNIEKFPNLLPPTLEKYK